MKFVTVCLVLMIVGSACTQMTQDQAIKNMATCLKNARELVPALKDLVQDFSFSKVPGLVNKIRSIMPECESFQYLKLDARCGSAVKSVGTNLKDNFQHYRDLISVSKIVAGINGVIRDLENVKNQCVRVSIYRELVRMRQQENL